MRTGKEYLKNKKYIRKGPEVDYCGAYEELEKSYGAGAEGLSGQAVEIG